MLEGKDLQRFLSKIDSTGDCWLWTDVPDAGMYGRFRLGKKQYGAHRLSYELFKGQSIPEGLVLDHLCCTPRCVNPHHLEAVSNAENIKRGRITNTSRKVRRLRTHCPMNHEFSEENTYINPNNGYRMCKECRRMWAREAYRASGFPRGTSNKDKTHCVQGHSYSGSNLGVRTRDGTRYCRQCRRDIYRRKKESKCSQ